MRKRAHVFFTGRVQGVGFRYSTRQVAQGYEVTGFVRNLDDGRVELIAEAEEDEARAFLAGLHESQLGSHIRSETVDWQPATGEYKGFQIRH